MSIAYHILKNEADSEECQNDTYLGAWNSIPPQNPNMFAAYLAKITRGLAINRLTANTREKRIRPSKSEPLSDLEPFLPGSSDVEGEDDRIINKFEYGKTSWRVDI